MNLNFNCLKNTKMPRWLLDSAIIFFIFSALIAISYLAFEKVYQNRVYPGVYIGQHYVGKKTAEEAKRLLNNEIDKINLNGVTFTYQGEKAVISPLVSSIDAELTYQVITFDAEQTINKAFSFGRDSNFFTNLITKLKALIYYQRLTPNVAVNENEIEKNLKTKFAEFDAPAENARLVIEWNNGNYQTSITEEKAGRIINYRQAIDSLLAELLLLKNEPIVLAQINQSPEITKGEVVSIDGKAAQVLKLAPINLKYNDKQWLLDKERLAQWLVLEKNNRGQAGDDNIALALDQEKVNEFFNQEISPEINQPPQDAKFAMKDGRVTEWQESRAGQELDIEASVKKIKNEIFNNNNNIDLVVQVKQSSINNENVNTLGIREIIGTGQSSFAGSPTNRRHNIKTGAMTLNGLLIKPDEEFSLLKALGEIDAAAGYLPELVIKGSKTIPEFGGGLCQIGTTIFRAALASGLPITARRNHSYRVIYYEPAGTDATIYNPAPDFKFLNDTGNYILIQARLEGDKLFFDFWSAKDGRAVEQTKPTIYNIVKPGPAKLIETTTLPAGEKKCTEKPHSGADAYFDYKVTYLNGEIKAKRFSSHYIPWQEVCLIGVEKPATEDTASSTPPVVSQ